MTQICAMDLGFGLGMTQAKSCLQPYKGHGCKVGVSKEEEGRIENTKPKNQYPTEEPWI